MCGLKYTVLQNSGAVYLRMFITHYAVRFFNGILRIRGFHSAVVAYSVNGPWFFQDSQI